ncbi:MAG: serine/threonine-protein kinase [archaeon]|nr:serine/threonine-protein kinase [archaeon]
MESSDISNTSSIIHALLTYISEELLHEYLKRIFNSLSNEVSQITKEHLINFNAFHLFINLPIFISDILFKLATKKKRRQFLSIEDFFDILKEAFIYGSSDDETIPKIKFFVEFFNEMSGNKKIFENDIKLVFYHFHMISNKNKQNISLIDEIVENFFGDTSHKVEEKQSMTNENFIEKIKTNSDLFYLFFFYLNTYKPFDQEEIKDILSNCFSIQETVRPVLLSNSDLTYNKIQLTSPTNELFKYLNSEYEISMPFYNEEDNDLKELDDFMLDMKNIKTQTAETILSFKFENNFCLYPHHLFDIKSKNLLFIVGSHLGLTNDKTNKKAFILHLGNKKKFDLLFQSIENASKFYKRFKQILNITFFDDKYQLIKQIEHGDYGKIIICKLKNNFNSPQFVVKTVDKGKSENYLWEVYINKFLSKLNLEGIAKIYDVFETKDKVYIVSEYVKNGSLNEYLALTEELLSAENIKAILKKIINSIKNLNKFGIIHRDIKPDNLLIDDNFDIKIIDFGFSKVIGTNQRCLRNCGTICFASPEILSKKSYDFKTDYWSIGIIAYYLQFGELPFDSEEDDTAEIIKDIKELKYDLPEIEEIENYSEFAYEIITKLLKFENERADISQFI